MYLVPSIWRIYMCKSVIHSYTFNSWIVVIVIVVVARRINLERCNGINCMLDANMLHGLAGLIKQNPNIHHVLNTHKCIHDWCVEYIGLNRNAKALSAYVKQWINSDCFNGIKLKYAAACICKFEAWSTITLNCKVWSMFTKYTEAHRWSMKNELWRMKYEILKY